MVRLALAVVLVLFAYPLVVLLSAQHGLALGPASLVLIFTLMGAITGLPVLFFLRRHGACGFLSVTICGALIGAALLLPVAYFDLRTAASLAKLFFLFGALHGAAIWLLGVWRNSAFLKPIDVAT